MPLPTQTISPLSTVAAEHARVHVLRHAVQAEYTTRANVLGGEVDVVISDEPLMQASPSRFARSVGGSPTSGVGNTHERRTYHIAVAGLAPADAPPGGGAAILDRKVVELCLGDRFLVPGWVVGRPNETAGVLVRVASKPQFIEGLWTAEGAV